MKNKNILDALSYVDEDLVAESEPGKHVLRRAKTVRLIAVIAAVLALAVSIPMIVVFANKAPEPETPVIAVTETKKETPEKTETPVVTPTPTETPVVTPTPTETPVVTPTPVETEAPVVTPTPVETETPVVTPTPTPTAQPTDTTTPTVDNTIGHLYYSSYGDRDRTYWFELTTYPCYVAVKFLEKVDNHYYDGTGRTGRQLMTEIKYEFLGGSGADRNLNKDTTELMNEGATLFVWDSQLEGLQSGDIIICQVTFQQSGLSQNSEEIFARSSYTESSFIKIIDGVVYEWTLEEGGNSYLYVTYKLDFNELRNKYNNGFEVVNKELFERMPDVVIESGKTTAEEFVAVMQWFEELKKVAVIKRNLYVLYDSFEVIV